jgi:hypothetical protein
MGVKIMADNNSKKVSLSDKIKEMSPRKRLIILSVIIFLITVALEAYSIYISK